MRDQLIGKRSTDYGCNIKHAFNSGHIPHGSVGKRNLLHAITRVAGQPPIFNSHGISGRTHINQQIIPIAGKRYVRRHRVYQAQDIYIPCRGIAVSDSILTVAHPELVHIVAFAAGEYIITQSAF